MASSPPQRLIFSPTLVCVELQSVVAIHLIHLALDLAAAALCRRSVCETHPSWAGPTAPETRSVRMWEHACPHLQGLAAGRKLVTSLPQSATLPPLTDSVAPVQRLPYWKLNGFLHLGQLKFLASFDSEGLKVL